MKRNDKTVEEWQEMRRNRKKCKEITRNIKIEK